MSKRKLPATPDRPAVDGDIARRTNQIALFHEITGDPHTSERAALEDSRRQKIHQYAKRPLRVFAQFDSFGDEWFRTVTDDCMHGASVARVLIPPGVPPEKLRAALEAFAQDYAADYEAIQDGIAQHAMRLIGQPDAGGSAFDDIPF